MVDVALSLGRRHNSHTHTRIRVLSLPSRLPARYFRTPHPVSTHSPVHTHTSPPLQIALAIALRNGAMPQLTQLELVGNNVGETGLCSLADAINSGKTPSLRGLVVGRPHLNHPQLSAACKSHDIIMV